MVSLIGSGERCPQSQRSPTSYYVCPECGTVVPIKDHCRSWECPEDWRLAASRASRSLISRFRDQVQVGNMQHWVLSPPAGWWQSDEPGRMYEAVARLIRRDMPEMAGVAILHPYRVRTPPDDIAVLRPRVRLCVSMRHLGGLDIDVEDVAFDAAAAVDTIEVYHGTWAALRERSDWEQYVYYSPHIHYIAAGYMLSSTQRRLRKRGWVIKRVRRLRDADDVSRVLMYLWSHAVYVGRKKKQYRVCIGRHWRLRRLHVVVREDYIGCPVCGGYMRRVDADFRGWVTDLPPAIRRYREVIWRLELR